MNALRIGMEKIENAENVTRHAMLVVMEIKMDAHHANRAIT